MRTIISITILTFASLCLLSSCSGNDTNASATPHTASSTNDSSALRVALLPIEECHPLRYAQESGLADSMGLNMILVEYDAMMDIDTAVLSDVAHVYFEDNTRMARIKSDSTRPTMLLPIPVRMSLIANKDKGIKDLPGLKAHMVGLTRTSALETWINALKDSANIPHDDVYHAQINSIPLRFRMLDGGLIDAAIIPCPWSDSLTTLEHTVIRSELLDGMGLFISASANADSTRREQAELLRKVYLEAITRGK